MQFSCKYRLLAKQLHQAVFVRIPIGYAFPCHTTFHRSLSHSSRNLGDKAWVYGFGDEIEWSESKVVNTIDVVNHIGNRLFGQVGNGMHSSHFHFFVDGCGVYIECTTEDIGETNNVVYLVGIVGTSRGDKHIRA